jgi:hypothetical protein
MEGAGLRRSEVVGCRWADIDVIRGRVRIYRKGRNWQWLPIDPDVLAELRDSFAELRPDLDDYVFVTEVEQWVSAHKRERRLKNPKRPSSDQALMRMLWRICRRAEVRRLSPHQLRHGFANRFLRESGRDFVALRVLMGHSRPDTTQQYTDDVELDELAAALDRAAARRHAQASPDPTTLEAELTDELERLRWRRRESNPRNVSAVRSLSLQAPAPSRTPGLACVRCESSDCAAVPLAHVVRGIRRSRVGRQSSSRTVQGCSLPRLWPWIRRGRPRRRPGS